MGCKIIEESVGCATTEAGRACSPLRAASPASSLSYSPLSKWRLIACLAAVVATHAVSGAESWPQLRGPTGDGVATVTQLPLTWSETNNIVWKARMPGRGRSSPVVMGDRIWLTTALEQGVRRTRIESDDMQVASHVTLAALCLDRADGKILWQTTLFEVDQPEPVHWLNSWATPTPVVEPGRLYCDFGTFGTACVDATTGKQLWMQRLASDHQVGPGSSPALWQDRLLLVRDGREAQYVAALDTHTGRIVWRTERPPIATSSGNLKKSFCTPLLIQTGDRTQMVVPGAHWIVAYAPDSGKEYWRLRHGNGFSIGASPAFGHGMVYFSTGCMKAQLLAVRADGSGELTATSVAWKSLRQVPVMSSPVLVGNEIYWISDEGMATCADARTGEILWQERLGGTYFASPLGAQQRIYFFNQAGKTTVVKAGRQFERLSENQIEGPLVATPAAVDAALFIRSDESLYRIGQR